MATRVPYLHNDTTVKSADSTQITTSIFNELIGKMAKVSVSLRSENRDMH